MKKKINVGHYNEAFFEKSETFIYNYIVHLENFHPVLFARRFVNLDLFNYPQQDCHTLPAPFPQRMSLEWFQVKLHQKLFGSLFTGEEILCHKHKIQIIHAHFAPQGFFASNWFEKARLPIITNFYGFDVSELPNDPLWAKRLKNLFAKGELFLVEGNFMRSKLIEIGCPEHKVQIQRIAIPLDKLAFRARGPKNPNERTIFLFCGRFVEKKGLRYALEAFSKVLKINQNFEFRIIGDGPLKQDITILIDQLGLSKNVTLLGFLNYQQYIEQMAKADIFIHPSITSDTGDSEGGAPTSILEAQAMGLPVISTTHADIPNVVKPQMSALLSKERDSEELAGNILFLLRNQQLWGDFGRTGRKFVEDFHDVKKEVRSLEEKYYELI